MYRKRPEEIRYILEGGKKLGAILEQLANMVVPGVDPYELDVYATEAIKQAGGRPAFRGYRPSRHDTPFPTTICFSVNDEVVHGIPQKGQLIQEGDVVSIDIGMQYPVNSDLGEKGNGFFTDTAVTVIAGEGSDEDKQLLQVTQRALYKGIAAMRMGNTVADIGTAVESYVQSTGNYGIVRDLSGHGVGHQIHEDPWVPNFFHKELTDWKLKEGVVLAIEPMLTEGTHEVHVGSDDWSILTNDSGRAAHFEHTVILTADGPVVATKRPSEDMRGV
jgi:methionyl aminopeptidase